MTEEMLRLARANAAQAGARNVEFPKDEYEAQLAAAGFTEMSVAFTHRVGDGLHSAIIKATRPADAPAGT